MNSLLFLAFLAAPMAVTAQPQLLRPDYYASICPDLESIVRGAVRLSIAHSPVAAPATLRLFFHDCSVRGCDASIMLMSLESDGEWRSADGRTLKPEGFDTVMSAKAAVDGDPRCRNKVSCADILALAARDAVFLSGGPYYEVELGRYDGTASTSSSVAMPHGTFDLDQLNGFFSGLGLSQTDMIALSGAHTIGAAACHFFNYRVGNSSVDAGERNSSVLVGERNSSVLAGDTAMDAGLAAQLRGACGATANYTGFAFLDGATPLRFDNAYYRNLRAGRGLLGSDQALYADPRSRGTVELYAADEDAFFDDFAAAMTRLGRVGVRLEGNGEIRRDCRLPN